MQAPPPNLKGLRGLLVILTLLGALAITHYATQKSTPPNPPKITEHDPLELEKTFAFAKIIGNSHVDNMLRKRQNRAKQFPKKLAYWIILGRAWIRKARVDSDPGFYINANAAAKVALSLAPDNPLALNLQGLVLLNSHKFHEAALIANKILTQNPNDVMALGTLSDASLELGRYKEAAHAAQKMVDAKPGLPSYSRASFIMWIRGETKGAKKAMSLAFDSGKSSKDREPAAWTLVQAAQYFWHEGDYKGARFGLKMTLRYYKNYPPALALLGKIALSLGKPQEAIPPLLLSYQKRPLPDTAWLLGDAYTAASLHQKAKDAYANVHKLGRQSDPRTLSLFLTTKNQQPKLALKLALHEFSIRQDIYTTDALAWALFRNGQLLKARKLIDRANTFETPDALLLYHAGAIRIAQGQHQAGRTLIQKALKLNPAFDYSASKEARLLLSKTNPTKK